MDNTEETRYNFKGLFKYISTVISWTIFTLLLVIGVLLIYYFISVRLYATHGEKFEPKFSVYTVVSESMEPTIDKYDVIVNTKIDSIDDVKVNDVVTYISTWQVNYGMTVTHRVIGTKTLDDGSKCLVTRGDNNTSEDPICVKKSNVIGIVRAVIPSLGRIQFFLSSSFGWLLIVLIPALYIIFKDILKIFHLSKDIKEEDKEKNKPDKGKVEDKIKDIEKEKAEEMKEEIENRAQEILKESKPGNKYLQEAYEELKKVKNRSE